MRLVIYSLSESTKEEKRALGLDGDVVSQTDGGGSPMICRHCQDLGHRSVRGRRVSRVTQMLTKLSSRTSDYLRVDGREDQDYSV